MHSMYVVIGQVLAFWRALEGHGQASVKGRIASADTADTADIYVASKQCIRTGSEQCRLCVAAGGSRAARWLTLEQSRKWPDEACVLHHPRIRSH